MPENKNLPAAVAGSPPCARDIDALVIKIILKDVAPRAICGCCVRAGYSPSTDPVASKELRQKMRADGWSFKMMDLGETRRVLFEKHNGQRFLLPCADADTEEMAVALAAIKAVELQDRLLMPRGDASNESESLAQGTSADVPPPALRSDTMTGDDIRYEVSRMDPSLIPGQDDYIAGCLVLFLAVCEIEDGWKEMEMGASEVLEIDGDRIPQMVANLRLGGALLEFGFCDPIQESLSQEGGGITYNCLIHIAMGRMLYDPSRDTYQLTPVGMAYVETELPRKQGRQGSPDGETPQAEKDSEAKY